MPDRPGLTEFYRHQGFEVKQRGVGMDLGPIFGFPAGVVPGKTERIFVRWS